MVKKGWHKARLPRFSVVLVSVVIIVTVWLVDLTMAVLLRREVFEVLSISGVIPWDAIDLLVVMFRVVGLVLMGITTYLAYRGAPLYKGRSGRLLFLMLLLGVGWFFCSRFSLSIGLIFPFTWFFLWSSRRFWSSKRFGLWPTRRLFYSRLAWKGSIFILFIWWIIIVGPRSTLKTIFPSLSSSPIILLSLLIFPPAYILSTRLWVEIWGQRQKIDSFWELYVESRLGLVGLGLVLAIVFMGVFAPFIAPYHWEEWFVSDKCEQEFIPGQGCIFEPPSRRHLLGTNMRGMDIFSRVIYGSRISLIVGFVASILAIIIGTVVGLLSGYYGGWLDTVLMRITDVFLSLPTLPFMLIFVALFGKGLQNIIIVIAILGWTGTARMVRSETLSLRERPLTEAAHAIGATDGYIIIHHIIPNTTPLIFANVVLGVVNAVLSEAGLTFLGFGDVFGQPSWGIVLHFAQSRGALLQKMWWWIIPPGLLIMVFVLGFAFISHAFDQVVNPRLRRRR